MINSSATAVAVRSDAAPTEVRDAVSQFVRLYPAALTESKETDTGWTVTATYGIKVIDRVEFLEGLDY